MCVLHVCEPGPMSESLDAKRYMSMLRGGAEALNARRQQIHDLNVFPIPDGDTGDNMYMTLAAGLDAAGDTLPEVAAAASRGMLMGARGNSGVILSRIFAGIAKSLQGGPATAGVRLFDKAMQEGVSESYKAVSEPVEGTILTVLREGVKAAGGSSGLEEYFDLLVPAMDLALARTPEQLPVLKQAGVVDSGGAGLLAIFEGMRDALEGRAFLEESVPEQAPAAPKLDLDSFTEDSVLEFGYCTEFLLRLQRSKVDLETFDERVLSDWLAAHGESLVFFRDGSIIKTHVHTHTPGEILNHCQQYGEFLTVKIENMTLQHHENHMEHLVPKPHKAFGVVAVASGEGLMQTFREMGADEVIEGGQTMNPSVQRFLEAFDRVAADTIFVLPDNANILLAAQQAAGACQTSDIRVIPCKTLGEGYYALANLDLSSGDADAIAQTLTAAAGEVVTGMVSRAIRTTEEVRKGDWAGFSGKRILASGPDPEQALTALADALDAGSHDVALIFAGEGAGPSADLSAALSARYPRTEVILQQGGQPVYDYILVLF